MDLSIIKHRGSFGVVGKTILQIEMVEWENKMVGTEKQPVSGHSRPIVLLISFFCFKSYSRFYKIEYCRVYYETHSIVTGVSTRTVTTNKNQIFLEKKQMKLRNANVVRTYYTRKPLQMPTEGFSQKGVKRKRRKQAWFQAREWLRNKTPLLSNEGQIAHCCRWVRVQWGGVRRTTMAPLQSRPVHATRHHLSGRLLDPVSINL